MLSTEVTNIPLNVRSILRDFCMHRRSPTIVKAFDAVVLLVFTAVRLVPLPFYLYSIFEYAARPDADPARRVVAVLGILPALLFIFWGKLMWGVVFGGGKAKESKER